MKMRLCPSGASSVRRLGLVLVLIGSALLAGCWWSKKSDQQTNQNSQVNAPVNNNGADLNQNTNTNSITPTEIDFQEVDNLSGEVDAAGNTADNSFDDLESVDESEDNIDI